MIAETENTPIAGATLADIEKRVASFARDYDTVRTAVAGLDAELTAVKARHLHGLRAAVARAKESKAALNSAIELNKPLFTKPRTYVFHGIKIGFTKGKGKLEIADESDTVKRIHQRFGADAIAWLNVTEKPNKDALADMPAGDLKKLGIELTETGDAVVIKPVDGEVDKICTALLKDQPEGV